MTSGPYRRHPGEATEASGLSIGVEVGVPSSSTQARVTKEARSGVPERISAEDYRLGPDPRASARVRIRANVSRRESCLKDPKVAGRIAWATLLLMDHQLMSSLSIGELMDQSMVNVIRISIKFH